MASVTVTPVIHPVFNEFDRFGLLLGLSRLEGERNPAYKWRLLDTFIHRASSTYYGLINGITRELGLEIIRAIKVTMPPDMDMPAIEFDGTKVILYENYIAGIKYTEWDRLTTGDGVWTIEELVDAINLTPFTAELLDDADGSNRSMGLFKQSSIGSVLGEDIEGHGTKIQLEHAPIIETTVSVSSSTLRQRVYSENDLRVEGQYYIDLDTGLLISTFAPNAGSRIRYKYVQNEYYVEFSPVIIHDIHSDNFKSTMFEYHGNDTWGRPTAIGADIVNELLSVFPYTWGK